MNSINKAKKSICEEQQRKQLALSYLRSISDAIETPETDPLLLDLSSNEINIEILRRQQISIQALKDENEKEALLLSECIDVLTDSSEKQLEKFMSLSVKLEDEFKKMHDYMQKINVLMNLKDIDAKLKKISELSGAFVKISESLNDEKIARIISIISG